MLPPRPTPRPIVPAVLVSLALFAAPVGAREDTREALWAAVRDGDTKAVQALLEKGADVNAKNEIGGTALWIAASKGKPEVIQLLLRAGADVNARDGIWYETPLSIAVAGGNVEIVTAVLRAGARDVDAAVIRAATAGKLPTLRAVLADAKPRREALDAALFAAPRDKKEVREALQKAGATPLSPVCALRL
jgi:ankyrin repeat protein